MESCSPISRLVVHLYWPMTVFGKARVREFSDDVQLQTSSIMIRQQDTDLFKAPVPAEFVYVRGAFGLLGAGAGWKTYCLGIAGTGLLCNSIYPLTTLPWNQSTHVRRPFRI